MTDEEVKQRIRYLVEHGGLWDDPQDDIRRTVRVNRVIAITLLTTVMVDLALNLLRL
jgi:hypothetical protein